MNGRQWILTAASREARAQIRGAWSLRGSRARWARSCVVGTTTGLLLGLQAGCAGGPDATESVPSAVVSLAGADVVVARLVIESADGAGVAEFEIQRPNGEREEVTHVVKPSSPQRVSEWLPAGADPDDRALITVHVQGLTWRSAGAIPLSAIEPRSFMAAGDRPPPSDAAGAENAAAFARFCERLTLHRDPMAGAPAPGGIARAWFGQLVAPTSHETLPVAATLADVTVQLFGGEDVALAKALVKGGWHTPSADATWTTPRWLALRDIIGADSFREALRRLVDVHGGRAPIGLAEVAESFEDDEAQAYVLAWFRGPSRPHVVTSWRHDPERERVLLRVDQTHEIKGDAIAAYSFTLPVTIVTEEGATLERSVTIERRRELFELPCEGTPIEVNVDPDATLTSRIELVRD